MLSSNFAEELGIATRAVTLYCVHMMRKAGAANIIERSRLIDELHSEGQDKIILPLQIIAKSRARRLFLKNNASIPKKNLGGNNDSEEAATMPDINHLMALPALEQKIAPPAGKTDNVVTEISGG